MINVGEMMFTARGIEVSSGVSHFCGSGKQENLNH